MKFPCCECFNSNIKDAKESSDAEYDKDEPSEYVVEKLVIKRIPIRLLEKQGAAVRLSPTPSESNNCTTKANISPLPDKKTNVTFESYYSMVPKSDIKSISPGSTPTREESETTLGSDEGSEHHLPASMQAKNVLSEEAERELVTKVLNTYSSIFTLDTKEAIPKDPCPLNMPKHPPDSPVYIPKHLRNQIPARRLTKVSTLKLLL